jgi:hypothetical protein
MVSEDTNGSVDLYRFDLEAPLGQRLSLISVDNEPADGTDAPTTAVLGASEGGERVYFVAQSQLVEGAPIPSDPIAQLIYLWDAGQIKYVGKAMRSELRDLVGELLGPKKTRVTPDGEHLLFLTSVGDQVVPHDHGECGDAACVQLYVYSAQANNGAGQLSCASCPLDGAAATSFSSIDFDAGVAGANVTHHQNRPLTDDGKRVFFSTTQTLVEEDLNTRYDAYQYTVATAELDLISSGRTRAGDAVFLDASATGDDVFFTTREQLVGWDRDASIDLYDARVGGGFLEPVIKHPCQGDACQGPAEPSPVFDAPASSTFRGAGNVKPSRGRRQ